jgi:hypothetical protein
MSTNAENALFVNIGQIIELVPKKNCKKIGMQHWPVSAAPNSSLHKY